jgi:hypothetical protein
MKIKLIAFAIAAELTVVLAQSPDIRPVAVTPDNFNRAETDFCFSLFVKGGALGKFYHDREFNAVDDKQPGLRANRDTLYSTAIFDLDAGPATITMPDSGGRFISLIVLDEDQYANAVYYGGGSHTLTKLEVGTRYVFAAIRIFADPANPKDLDEVHALQDAIKIDQPGGPGVWEVPNWDPVSQNKVRQGLLLLSDTLPDTKRSFGARGEVDPVRHLISTAAAFAGNPDKYAVYINVTPQQNDGTTMLKLTVPSKVPVESFWSISVYNEDGYFEKNPLDAYTLNNVTAKKNADGSVAVQFGGCDGKIPNCLPIMQGWSYMVRLYRPGAEILAGNWKFPEARPVQ